MIVIVVVIDQFLIVMKGFTLETLRREIHEMPSGITNTVTIFEFVYKFGDDSCLSVVSRINNNIRLGFESSIDRFFEVALFHIETIVQQKLIWK